MESVLPDCTGSTRAARLSALTRRLVIDCVGADLDLFLSGKREQHQADDSFVAVLFQALLDFPLFRDADGMDSALRELFDFIPHVDQKLARASSAPSGTGIRRRILRLICSPIVSAKRTMQTEHHLAVMTANQQKYAAKNRLVSWIQRPRGAARLVTAVMQSHAIGELPAPLRDYVSGCACSAVDNVVHQLAKEGPRRKIQNMYSILPRGTIVAMLKLHAGRR